MAIDHLMIWERGRRVVRVERGMAVMWQCCCAVL